jgi:hypothetical protein
MEYGISLDVYRIPKPKFISHTKTYIYIVYQNLELYHIPKPRFIQNTNILYQNLHLYHIQKPKFIARYKSRFWYALLI